MKQVSHPTWVCGLKLIVAHVMGNFTVSHPTWVCGLKPNRLSRTDSPWGHTLRGCVD